MMKEPHVSVYEIVRGEPKTGRISCHQIYPELRYKLC